MNRSRAPTTEQTNSQIWDCEEDNSKTLQEVGYILRVWSGLNEILIVSICELFWIRKYMF